MLAQEHAQTALDFLEKADQYFAEGDQIQASEKLWGAAAHAILSVSMERGWPGSSHRAMKEAAERLADEYSDPLISAEFSTARQYHRDFYHLFLEDYEWLADRPKIRDFVTRVLALRNGDGGRSGQS